jgi:hypothetical protein
MQLSLTQEEDVTGTLGMAAFLVEGLKIQETQ